MRYRDGDGRVTSRRVDPQLLASTAGHWYLVAHCRLRGELRWFRWTASRRPPSLPDEPTRCLSPTHREASTYGRQTRSPLSYTRTAPAITSEPVCEQPRPHAQRETSWFSESGAARSHGLGRSGAISGFVVSGPSATAGHRRRKRNRRASIRPVVRSLVPGSGFSGIGSPTH
ncbi:WYL domain-containing protein (plasmid) [Gordonia polyisoprenivorans]|uniref:helix-turn-helix transcriptional regulator n=1 Tax=Gordonia polyisoprenivorans TaxID=84595 RepID=UPI002B28AE9D|nr:WYL domain-containing protein [Gordonia polyisoprenivorans]